MKASRSNLGNLKQVVDSSKNAILFKASLFFVLPNIIKHKSRLFYTTPWFIINFFSFLTGKKIWSHTLPEVTSAYNIMYLEPNWVNQPIKYSYLSATCWCLPINWTYKEPESWEIAWSFEINLELKTVFRQLFKYIWAGLLLKMLWHDSFYR